MYKKAQNRLPLLAIITSLIAIVAVGFNAYTHKNPPINSWCDKPLRQGLEKLKEIKTCRPWFKVCDVGHGTYAIDEPYNWEETISYLILGKDSALLFDTGMGLDSISLAVKQLTQLPIVVLNSHTHPDHIGGNAEFEQVLAMNIPYTRQNAANGYSHDQVKWEVNPASICLNLLPQKDTANYYIRSFKVSKFIGDGYLIDLGQRKLQVIAAPGHNPDAICLYDQQAGYFWCGDSFYEGPILLTDDVADLKAYQKTMKRMAQFAAMSNCVLPAHNLPTGEPTLLIKAAQDFEQIATRTKKGKPGENNTVVFDCGKYSYQIGEKFIKNIAGN